MKARAILGLAIAAQLAAAACAPRLPPAAAPGPAPAMARWLAFGEDALAARLTVLALQAADDRAGERRALRELDMAQVEAWLDTSVRLDPRSSSPLHAAQRLYAPAAAPAACRRLLDWAARQGGAPELSACKKTR